MKTNRQIDRRNLETVYSIEGSQVIQNKETGLKSV